MTIHKSTPSEFVNRSVMFTSLPSHLIAELGNAEAIAIWAYLCSKPSDWIVRKSDIMDTLNIGRVKYSSAIKILIEKGLIRMTTLRDEHGNLMGSGYDVYNIPVTEGYVSAALAKARLSRKRDCRETEPLSNNRGITNNRSSKKEILENTDVFSLSKTGVSDQKQHKIKPLEVFNEWKEFSASREDVRTCRSSKMTTTDVNNIRKCGNKALKIDCVHDELKEPDFHDLTTKEGWISYWIDLLSSASKIDKRHKTFSWAVRETTRGKYEVGTYEVIKLDREPENGLTPLQADKILQERERKELLLEQNDEDFEEEEEPENEEW